MVPSPSNEESGAQKKPSNARYEFELELSGAHVSLDVPTTYAGAVFHGRLQLTFRETLTIEHLSIKLSYRVSGSGSPETHELAHLTFDAGEVKANQKLAKRISLSVPDSAPISYEGAYIKIVWSVSLELFLDSQECFVEQVPVLVLPRPVDFDPQASPKSESELEKGFIRISNIQPKLELPTLERQFVSGAAQTEASLPAVKIEASGLALDIMDPPSDIDSSDTLPVPDDEIKLYAMDLPDESK